MYSFEKRLKILYIFASLMFIPLISGLFFMQVVKGEGYRKEADLKMHPIVKQQAPRGEITDRNGVVLAGNKVSYSLNLIKDEGTTEELNLCIDRIFKVLDKNSVVFEDTLPITYDCLNYTFADDAEKEKWFKNFGYKKYVNEYDVNLDIIELLDDVFSELDSVRQKKLYQIFVLKSIANLWADLIKILLNIGVEQHTLMIVKEITPIAIPSEILYISGIARKQR